MADYSIIENDIGSIKEMVTQGDADVRNKMGVCKDYQQTGTKFYGFKIGMGESNWDQSFDKVYDIHYESQEGFKQGV